MDNQPVLEAYRKMSYERGDRDRVTLIQPDELLPDARKLYDEAIHVLGVESIPVLLDKNRDGTDEAITTGTIRQTPYLAISEYSHRWDAEYVQRLSLTNAELEDTFERVSDPMLLRRNEEISAQLGLSQPPVLYYNDRAADNNFADISQEGVLYIALDPVASREVQLVVLSHEIGHHALGQTSFEQFAILHNAQSNALRHELERAADSQAAQVCDGVELAAVLQMNRDRRKREAEAKGEASGIHDQKRNGSEHPPTEQRVADLLAQAKALEEAGLCVESHAGLKEALPGMKQVSGGADVGQNNAPAVSGGRTNAARDVPVPR